MQLNVSKWTDITRSQEDIICLVDLFAHKNPKMRILDLSGQDEKHAGFSETLLNRLRADTAFKRFSSYDRGFISESGGLISRNITSISDLAQDEDGSVQKNRQFDLVVLPLQGDYGRLLSHGLHSVEAFTSPEGTVVASFSTNIGSMLSKVFTSMHVTSIGKHITIGYHSSVREATSKQKSIVLVTGRSDCDFDQLLRKELMEHFGKEVQMISADQLHYESIRSSDIVVTTMELHAPIFDRLDETLMTRIKILTENASNLIWITGCPSIRPEFSLVQGLSRTLRVEQPSLRFFIYSTELPCCEAINSVRRIIGIVDEALTDDFPDTEFMERDGLVFVSRFEPDESMNESFQKRQAQVPADVSLVDILPAQLTIGSVGHFDTFHMKQLPPSTDDLDADYVELDVKAFGLNAKSVYAAAGRIDIKDGMSAFECTGIVTRVGSAVSDLVPGDRILAMALCQLSTVERIPKWSCMKLRNEEDYNSIVTLPTVYATAIHGLCEKANLQAGETVLIHSAAGGVGIAAIQIAQLRGAKIFATVGTQEKKEFLVQEFGLDAENIFSSRDLSFVSGILAATENRGVNVILNSLTGDLLHESWRLCARFGRFVEIGKHDLSSAGRLDMQVFLRSVSFIAIDLVELYHPQNPTSRNSHPL